MDFWINGYLNIRIMKWWNNMRRIFFVLLVMLMATFVCVRANTPVDKTSSSLIQSLNLPSTTQVAAESTHLVVFTNVDSIDNDMDVVTLWTYKPKDKTLLKLLTTNPRSNYECLGYGDKAQRVSFTSILTINNVYINAEEDKILVEGNDDRNCYSYIISLTEGLPTIQLPCHAGVLGMSSEEELPIAQSYAYYKGGGRYNIISVFDWNGKCLKHFSLKGMGSQ